MTLQMKSCHVGLSIYVMQYQHRRHALLNSPLIKRGSKRDISTGEITGASDQVTFSFMLIYKSRAEFIGMLQTLFLQEYNK